MREPRAIDQDDDDATRDLLVGHRIVKAETGSFEWFDYGEYRSLASGRLTLDDGTQVLVAPNEGGCICGAGDYVLSGLAEVDNIITSVRLDVEDEAPEYERSYRIYVVADNVEVNAVTIKGDDGNGYYGTGYELIVLPPVREATS